MEEYLKWAETGDNPFQFLLILLVPGKKNINFYK